MYKQTVTLRKGSLLLILAMSTSLAVALTGCGGGGVSSIQGPVGSAPPPGVDGQPKPEVPSPVVTTETPPPDVTTAVSSPVVSNRAPGDSQAPVTDTVVTDTVGSDLIENIEILAVGNHRAPMFEYLEEATRTADAAKVIAKIGSKPNLSGAPTQSSNVDSATEVTTDSVSVSTPLLASDGYYRFDLSNSSGGQQWSFGRSEGIREVISSGSSGYSGYREVDTRKGITDATLYVNTFSNIDEKLQFTGTVPPSEQVAVPSGARIGQEGSYPTITQRTSSFSSTLNGEVGVFSCFGTCTVTNGHPLGNWQFTPRRPRTPWTSRPAIPSTGADPSGRWRFRGGGTACRAISRAYRTNAERRLPAASGFSTPPRS